MSDKVSIKVAVRCRPLNAKEDKEECVKIFSKEKQAFTYDYLFGPNSTQNQVFEMCVRPLLGQLFEGYNVTVMAYGQTGSGKTYTMGTASNFIVSSNAAMNNRVCDNKEISSPSVLPSNKSNNNNAPARRKSVTEALLDDIGVLPKTVDHLFQMAKAKSVKNRKSLLPSQTDTSPQTHANNVSSINFKFSVSFIEIYKEDIIDLLNPTTSSHPNGNDNNVYIREDPNTGGIKLMGAREENVANLSETLHFLQLGSACRSTARTAMNSTSSRSHAIFTVTIEKYCGEETSPLTRSKIHFVDLAGSERAKKTQAEGERFKEGVNINLGLLALGNVIKALSDDTNNTAFIPYRDSKLTRILQDSLGGNSHTVMIACISPSIYNCEETLNTLRYADRARRIKNKPIVNIDPVQAEIARLNAKILQLEKELATYRKLPKPLEDTICEKGSNKTTTNINESINNQSINNNNNNQASYNPNASNNNGENDGITHNSSLDGENNEELSSEVKSLSQAISEKENLIQQMLSNETEIVALKEKFEHEVEEWEKEKESLLSALREAQKNRTIKSDISEKRRKRLQELETKISAMNRKIAEHDKLVKLKDQNKAIIEKLKKDVQELKENRVRLLRQIRDEAEKNRKLNAAREKDALRFKNDLRKREIQYSQKEEMLKLQQMVLKRKNEEIIATNKRLKDILARQKNKNSLNSTTNITNNNNTTLLIKNGTLSNITTLFNDNTLNVPKKMKYNNNTQNNENTTIMNEKNQKNTGIDENTDGLSNAIDMLEELESIVCIQTAKEHLTQLQTNLDQMYSQASDEKLNNNCDSLKDSIQTLQQKIEIFKELITESDKDYKHYKVSGLTFNAFDEYVFRFGSKPWEEMLQIITSPETSKETLNSVLNNLAKIFKWMYKAWTERIIQLLQEEWQTQELEEKIKYINEEKDKTIESLIKTNEEKINLILKQTNKVIVTSSSQNNLSSGNLKESLSQNSITNDLQDVNQQNCDITTLNTLANEISELRNQLAESQELNVWYKRELEETKQLASTYKAYVSAHQDSSQPMPLFTPIGVRVKKNPRRATKRLTSENSLNDDKENMDPTGNQSDRNSVSSDNENKTFDINDNHDNNSQEDELKESYNRQLINQMLEETLNASARKNKQSLLNIPLNIPPDSITPTKQRINQKMEPFTTNESMDNKLPMIKTKRFFRDEIALSLFSPAPPTTKTKY